MADQDPSQDQGTARLRAALDRPLDEAALSRAVLTRLAGPPARRGWAGPRLALAAYASLALALGVAGYQGGGMLAAPDPVLALALGSVGGLLQ